MLPPTLSLLALSLLTTLSRSSPLAAGSKHNIYLSTCNPSCLLLCDPDDAMTAALYFPNGPIAPGATRASPSGIGRVPGRKPEWEGPSKKVRIGSAGTLKTGISAEAKGAEKGSLVGGVELGEEPFVCFKDGQTKFGIVVDLERWECVADYWCPSIDVEG